MNSTHQEIHLWPELLRGGNVAPGIGADMPCAPIPLRFAPTKLVLDRERVQLFDPLDQPAASGVLVEPFLNQRKQLKLLATFPSGAEAQVNGGPAPWRAVLKVGDFIQWSAGIAFHVTAFNRPEIGRPPVELIGKACPVCRVPFAADSRCYTCACGAAVHAAAVETELQCAQLRGECPRCKRPVVLEPGYAFTPTNE